MIKLLTIDDAYDAAINFLHYFSHKYYTETGDGDILLLTDDMRLLEDDCSADPAAQSDWQDSIDKVLSQRSQSSKTSKVQLTTQEAYKTIIDFLEGYCSRTNSDETRELLNAMALQTDGSSVTPEALKDWIKSVNKILNQNPRIRPRFTLLPSDEVE